MRPFARAPTLARLLARPPTRSPLRARVRARVRRLAVRHDDRDDHAEDSERRSEDLDDQDFHEKARVLGVCERAARARHADACEGTLGCGTRGARGKRASAGADASSPPPSISLSLSLSLTNAAAEIRKPDAEAAPKHRVAREARYSQVAGEHGRVRRHPVLRQHRLVREQDGQDHAVDRSRLAENDLGGRSSEREGEEAAN